jgi:hypothetical protein
MTRDLRCIIRDMKTHRYTPTPPMPTKRHRVQVMLAPEHFATLRDLAKAARLSMSRIAADVIEEAAPIMARSLAMLNDAATLTEEAKKQLRRDIAREERTMTRAASLAYGSLAATEAAIRKAGGLTDAQRPPAPRAPKAASRRRPDPR